MLVQTRHWGAVEVEYWRDEFGREGFYTCPAEILRGLPPSIIQTDLVQPAQWPQLLISGAAHYAPKEKAPDVSAEERMAKARDRMARARAARKPKGAA